MRTLQSAWFEGENYKKFRSTGYIRRKKFTMKSVDHIIIGGGIDGLIAAKNKIGTCALRPPLAGILMYSPGEESTR